MPKFADVGKVINTNATQLGHQSVLFSMKSCQVAAGWQVKCSSDGTTFNPTGDQITHLGTGAGGLSNHNAWYVIEEPGAGRRQWCVQSSAAGAMQARFKYSALAKFIGGTPTAQRTPAAADERIMLGGGTDAAPSYAAICSTGGTYRYHCIALSHAISGAYGFYCFYTAAGTGSQGYGMWFQEPMLPGTFTSEGDGDPVIVHSTSGMTYSTVTYGWLGFGTPGQVWGAMTAQNISNLPSYGTDLGNGADINVRPWWTSNQAGAWRLKGCSAVLANRAMAGRAYPATMNRVTDSCVYLADWVWPYPDNVEPSIA